MGSVTIAVVVDVILRDSLVPRGAIVKLCVVDVDTGMDDIHVNILTAGGIVIVESESPETEFRMIGDTGKTLGGGDITNYTTRVALRDIPME